MRKSQFDSLPNDGDWEKMVQTWNEGSNVLPEGRYPARTLEGKLQQDRKEQWYCRITFQVIEGPYKNACFVGKFYLTPNAIEWTKQRLAKLGITNPEQLRQPWKERIICECDVEHYKGRPQMKTLEVISKESPNTEASVGGDDNERF